MLFKPSITRKYSLIFIDGFYVLTKVTKVYFFVTVETKMTMKQKQVRMNLKSNLISCKENQKCR